MRDAACEPPDDDVEDRREEETEERHAQHPGEDGDAHRLTNLEAGAGGKHERYDSHYKCERRHENRAQPDAAGSQDGLARRLAFILPLLRELDDEDRVLARKPGEHEKTDLREHIVVAAGEP